MEKHPSLPTLVTFGGASSAANLGNIGFLEHAIGRASIAANLGNIGFLEHAIGRASIAANLGNARFLEHIFGGASIAPGMHTGLEAMSAYRTKRAGCLGHLPGEFGDAVKDSAWLLH